MLHTPAGHRGDRRSHHHQLSQPTADLASSGPSLQTWCNCFDCNVYMMGVKVYGVYITILSMCGLMCAYVYIIIYMSDCENPRFREKTSTNLGRSHRLPHVCTIMIYGKLGGYRLQEAAAFIYIYIRDEPWIICDIWVSLMWILEKYDDITLKRGIANLGRSHRLPRVFNNFHQFP